LPVIMAMTMKASRTQDAHRQVTFSVAARATVAVAVAIILVFGVWPTGPLAVALDSAKSLGAATSGRR
jgi:NADH:ubiquinone oxidoreductase subunit 2 (subunit N)